MTSELVEIKLSKMRRCVRFYLWLNRSFTEIIMFKNQRKELERLLTNHTSGDVRVPTELERIVEVEAHELIRNYYDNV